MRIACSRVWVATVAAIACGTGAYLLSGSLIAQSVATPSFTEAQATQGKAVYDRNCLSCHGSNLDDGEFGPALKGVEFRIRWGAKPIDGLFGEMMRMPPAAPGSLGEDTYVQVLAGSGIAGAALCGLALFSLLSWVARAGARRHVMPAAAGLGLCCFFADFLGSIEIFLLMAILLAMLRSEAAVIAERPCLEKGVPAAAV